MQNRNSLLEDNRGLLWKIARDHGRIGLLEVEDVYQELCIHALDMVGRYDPERGKISTFLGRALWCFLKRLRERNAEAEEDKRRVYRDTYLGSKPTPAGPGRFYEDLLSDLRLGLSIESPELDSIVGVLMGAGGNQREAARKLGTSKSTVHRKVQEIRQTQTGQAVAAFL